MNTTPRTATWALSVLFLTIGTPAFAGDLKELHGFTDTLTGRVFLRQNLEPIDAMQAAADDSSPHLSAQHPAASRGRLQGRHWAGGPPGADPDPDLGSDRVKRLGLTLDEGGIASSVAASGNYCYVGTAGSLAVFDVTDPTQPVLGREIDEPAVNLEIQATKLAAIMGSGGDFVLFDVSDPGTPVETSRIAAPEGFYYHDVALGDTAAIAIGYGYLDAFGFCAIMQVIDISDPSQAKVNSTVLGVLEYFRDILLDGNIVYLAADINGVSVYDITDTQRILLLAQVPDVWCRPVGMDVQGNILCLIGYGMQMVDVSDPSLPVVIGVGFSQGFASDVRIRGDLAFAPNDDDTTLSIFDISDPTDPFVTAQHQAYGKVFDLFVDGNWIFLPDIVYGLLVMDITVPTSPQLTSMTSTGTTPMGIDVEGDRAAATANFAGLHTVDVSDPFDPQVLGSFLATPKPGGGNTLHQVGIDLADNSVVTGDWSSDSTGWIHTYDVADPTQPEKKGELEIGDWFAYCPVQQLGNLVYTGKEQLLVIDISDPTQPVEVGTGPTFGFPLSDLQLSGNILYVSTWYDVAVIDVSNPAAPQELSRFSTSPRAVFGLAVENDVLGVHWESNDGLFVQYSAGLQLYDVTDPLSPSLLGEVDYPQAVLFSSGGGGTLATENGKFYSCTPQRLFVVDARDPSHPILAAAYPDEPCYAVTTRWFGLGKVSANNGLAYLTSNEGVEVLRFLDVGVLLTSSSDGGVLSRGDRFDYEMRLENFTSEPQHVVVWTDVLLSNGMTGTPGYPVQPQVVRLNPGESIVHQGHGLIPFNAPPGTYELFVRVGTLADGELDCDRIVIDVSP